MPTLSSSLNHTFVTQTAVPSPASCAGPTQAAHSVLLSQRGSSFPSCSWQLAALMGSVQCVLPGPELPDGTQHLGGRASCWYRCNLISSDIPEILCSLAFSGVVLPLKPWVLMFWLSPGHRHQLGHSAMGVWCWSSYF